MHSCDQKEWLKKTNNFGFNAFLPIFKLPISVVVVVVLVVVSRGVVCCKVVVSVGAKVVVVVVVISKVGLNVGFCVGERVGMEAQTKQT